LYVFIDSPTFEEFLRMLTMEALKQNDGLRRLHTVLTQEHWNGMLKCLNFAVTTFLKISKLFNLRYIKQ